MCLKMSRFIFVLGEKQQGDWVLNVRWNHTGISETGRACEIFFGVFLLMTLEDFHLVNVESIRDLIIAL